MIRINKGALMEELIAAFKKLYPESKMRLVKSPLRICPLGAHVDHQHGLVTGMALETSVHLAYSPNEQGYITVQSLDFPDEEYFHIDHVPDKVPHHWSIYLRGAVRSLSRSYKLKRGMNACISGKLPIGGLS